MNRKTKILIGILIVGIILAGGWWVWNFIKPTPAMTDKVVVGDRYCKQDNDCVGTCELECVNKYNAPKEEPPCYARPVCECVNNRCVQKQQVTIATDKTEYEQGETVKITARNGLDKSIWDFGVCGLQPWWGLQRFEKDQWKMINFSLATLVEEEVRGQRIYKEVCDFILCEKPEIIDLKPDSEISYNWHLGSICEWPLQPIGVPKADPEIIEEGTYRFFLVYGFYKDFSFSESKTIYSPEFTIKEKSATDPRCEQKVKGTMVSGTKPCTEYREGYEFDSSVGKCTKKGASGCLFIIPFNTLEECQEVCENKERAN